MQKTLDLLQHMTFQQDGAPLHFAWNVRTCWSETFTDYWIGIWPTTWHVYSPIL